MRYEKLLIKCHLVSSLAKLPLHTCDIFYVSFRSKTNTLLRLFCSSACLATWKQYRKQQLFYSFSTASPSEYNVFGLNLIPKYWNAFIGCILYVPVCLRDDFRSQWMKYTWNWVTFTVPWQCDTNLYPSSFIILDYHLALEILFFSNKSPVTLFSRYMSRVLKKCFKWLSSRNQLHFLKLDFDEHSK